MGEPPSGRTGRRTPAGRRPCSTSGAASSHRRAMAATVVAGATAAALARMFSAHSGTTEAKSLRSTLRKAPLAAAAKPTERRREILDLGGAPVRCGGRRELPSRSGCALGSEGAACALGATGGPMERRPLAEAGRRFPPAA